MRQPPIFVNVRDRMEDLRLLVGWLLTAGYERVTLIDNASTWPPLLEFLEVQPFKVHRLEKNGGSKSLWKNGLVPQDERFVLTDPDIMPIPECPMNVVDVLWDVLDRYPAWPKAGLGLYIEDTPDFQSKKWEETLVTPGSGRCQALGKFADVDVLGSLVDTTFALYRPGHNQPFNLRGIRLGYPCQAYHRPWYRIDTPTVEDRYYLDRAIEGPTGSSWAEGKQ